METKYYYHDRDGELHGPSDLDFLIREVKWGGLPADLTVRPRDGGEWMPLADAVKGKPEAGSQAGSGPHAHDSRGGGPAAALAAALVLLLAVVGNGVCIFRQGVTEGMPVRLPHHDVGELFCLGGRLDSCRGAACHTAPGSGGSFPSSQRFWSFWLCCLF